MELHGQGLWLVVAIIMGRDPISSSIFCNAKWELNPDRGANHILGFRFLNLNHNLTLNRDAGDLRLRLGEPKKVKCTPSHTAQLDAGPEMATIAPDHEKA
jgi:hypothetical protein